MEAATVKDLVQSGTTAGIWKPTKGRFDAGVAWIPYVLAVFFSLSALRGVGSTDVVDTDAARHAMNGAFIYDMVRGGHIMHPIEYAKQYYGHLPALTMPYHPPMFPAIEALFFSLLGVKLLAARAAVAISVGISVLLLYSLVQATLGSRILATCVTVTTLSLWTFRVVSRDVMLEFPALAFTLAALYCLRDMDRSFTVRRALLFGVLAAAAVWTKQHTVFLGAMPFLCVMRKGQRHLFLEKPLWIGTAIFTTAVLCLMALSKQGNNTGIDQVSTSARDVYWILTATIPAYLTWIATDLKGFAGVFMLSAIVIHLGARRKRSLGALRLEIYFSWIVSYGFVLLVLGDTNSRYLFFVYPAFVTIGYAWLFQGCTSLWGERRARFVMGGFAITWLAVGFLVPREFLRGPGEAAAFVTSGSPARILYAGEADGNFIFSIRSFDPQLLMTVIPAGKLPAATFEPDALESFCRQFGVDWIVFENVQRKLPWSHLADARPAYLKLERSFPIASSRSRWRTGTIDVYRLNAPANPPGGVLQLPVYKLGGTIGVKF